MSETAIGLQVGHPSPARHRANSAILVLSLCAPPAAWMGQLLFSFAASSYVCSMGMARTLQLWLAPAITAVNILAIVAAVLSLIAAGWLIRLTKYEHDGQPGGILDAGEGGTRFLSVWCSGTAAVFLVAILADTLCLHLVPLCR